MRQAPPDRRVGIFDDELAQRRRREHGVAQLLLSALLVVGGVLLCPSRELVNNRTTTSTVMETRSSHIVALFAVWEPAPTSTLNGVSPLVVLKCCGGKTRVRLPL